MRHTCHARQSALTASAWQSSYIHRSSLQDSCAPYQVNGSPSLTETTSWLGPHRATDAVYADEHRGCGLVLTDAAAWPDASRPMAHAARAERHVDKPGSGPSTAWTHGIASTVGTEVPQGQLRSDPCFFCSSPATHHFDHYLHARQGRERCMVQPCRGLQRVRLVKVHDMRHGVPAAPWLPARSRLTPVLPGRVPNPVRGGHHACCRGPRPLFRHRHRPPSQSALSGRRWRLCHLEGQSPQVTRRQTPRISSTGASPSG